MIAAFEPWHLMSIVLRMREADSRELVAFGFPTDPVSRQRWACRTALECLAGVTAIDSTGKPAGCFGVREGANSRVAVAFLITCEGWRAHLKEGIRAWRRFSKVGAWPRIEAACMAEIPQNARLLEHMGFKFDCALPAVREDGGDLLLYSMKGTS